MRLVGGTALALQLGHRFSIDLDFFGTMEATTTEIINEFCSPDFNIVVKQDTKSIKVLYINNIKVDIVNYPYKWLEPAIETDGVRMAGLKDIAAMKLSAITNRGTKKDFVDLYFLLQHYSLMQMITFYEQKYPNHSSFMVLRSLAYFEDAEEQPLPKIYSKLDWETIKIFIQKEVRNYDAK
jgi:predicted nucleotidyltransferase component of viral defense system